jgi:hypothetical protein
MTDKVQKIREEVIRLKSRICNNSFLSDYEKGCNDGREDICDNLISFIDSLQEEPVSEELEEAAWQYYDRNKPLLPSELVLHKELIDFFKAGVRWKEQNDSNLSEVLYRDNLDEMAEGYSSCTYLEEVLGEGDREVLKARLKNTFKAGTEWQKKHLWKDAQGDDLPEYEREVVVFTQNFSDDAGIMMVAIGHRPTPEGYDGKSLATGEVEHYTPKTYDKGEWNIPDVMYWLDVVLPKEMEE